MRSQFWETIPVGFSISGTEEGRMLYKLGRLLQIVGLILLPLAIAGNLAPENAIDLRTSLLISGAGILVFGLGWLIQQAGRPR
jgi:hypothetical protein